jgi:hypothetical protein
MAPIGFSSYCTLKLLFSRVTVLPQGHSPASSLAWILLLPQPPISMNHKILTNQIMLSPTEGYLSPCPLSLFLLALSALSLFHPAIKNLWPDHSSPCGHFGAYISLHLVPWLGAGFPTNPGGTPIPTHHDHPEDVTGQDLSSRLPSLTSNTRHSLVSPPTLLGLHLRSFPLVVFPCFGLSLGGSDDRGIPFSTGFGFYRAQDPTKPRPW